MVLSWWTSTPPIQQSDTIHERGSPVTHSKVRDHLPVVLVSNWHQKSGVKTKEKKLYSPAHPWRHLRALAAKKNIWCAWDMSYPWRTRLKWEPKKDPWSNYSAFYIIALQTKTVTSEAAVKRKCYSPGNTEWGGVYITGRGGDERYELMWKSAS